MLSTLWRRLSNGLTQNATAAYFRAQKPHASRIRGYHCYLECFTVADMQVQIHPVYKHNYMFLIADLTTNEAAIVDVGDVGLARRALERGKFKLTTILITHSHSRHFAGAEILAKLSPGSRPEVVGGDKRICGLTRLIKEGYEQFKIGKLYCTCISTPGHSPCDVSYCFEAPSGVTVIFTGDTLFQGGCGMVYESPAEQMYTSLNVILAALPDETKVFCGHENTVQNLSFAAEVEPNNRNIKNRLAWAKFRRVKHLTTLPSTIGQEKLWNPFMRLHCEDVLKYTGELTPVKAMIILQEKRNSFLERFKSF